MIRNRLRPLAPLAVLLVAVWPGLAGCDRSAATTASSAPGDEVPVNVGVTSVARATVRRTVLLPAEVRPWQEVTLYARVPGYVSRMLVDRGDAVRAGAVVAELETPELDADVAKARADVALASTLAGRVHRAHSKAPDLVVAQKVDEAAAQLEVARAALSRAETLRGFASIRAPFDGLVTERFVDPGAFVPAATAASSQRSAAVVVVADFRRVRVAVPVPEREARFVRAGSAAEVLVDEAGGEVRAASVERISWTLEPGTRTMIAEIDVANDDLQLRPGMIAHARIAVEQHAGVLAVPPTAVRREKAGAFVFIVAADRRIRKMPVRTGFDDGRSVEILDGVAEGQTVALAADTPLRDGQAVAPR